MSITQDDFKKIWASTSSISEYTFSDSDYQDGWEFVGNLPPTRAMWDTLQRRNDQKMKYLQDKCSMCFDSVADMVASNLEAGQTVITKGYHNPNDGGTAVYTIRAKTQSDVDDGGSIIFIDNGNVAELITDGTVNVKQFGAKGDGITDDYDIIQNILTTISPCNIVFPFGTYIVSHKLIVPGGVNAPWINLENSTIKASSSFSDDYVIQIGQTGEYTTTIDYSSNRKKGIFNGNIDANGTTSGLLLLNAESAVLYDINILNCNLYGVRSSKDMLTSMDSYFYNVFVKEVHNNNNPDSVGFLIESHDSSYYALKTLGFRTGVKVTGGSNCFVDTHPFYSNGIGPADIYPNTIGVDVSGVYNQFINCYADNQCIGIQVAGRGNIFKNYFYFVYYQSNDNAYAIKLINGNNIVDGVTFSFPKSRNGRILADNNGSSFGTTKASIRNIKWDENNCDKINYGVDFAWNVSINPDAKTNIYRPYYSHILTGTKVPLFVILKGLNPIVRFSLQIDNKRYDVIFNYADSNPFEYEGSRTGANDGILNLSTATLNGFEFYVISYIPPFDVGSVTVELMSPNCIPVVGFIDLIDTIPYGSQTNINVTLGTFSGITFPTGIYPSGNFFRFNGSTNLKQNLTLKMNMNKSSGEQITLATNVKIPNTSTFALVNSNGVSAVTGLLWENNEWKINLPFAITAQNETLIKFV